MPENTFYCTQCRKTKPSSEFCIKPSGEPYSRCKKHFDIPEFSFIHWTDLENRMSLAIECQKEMNIRCCIKFEHLPIQAERFQVGKPIQKYQKYSRLLTDILDEKLNISFYMRRDVVGTDYWSSVFYCRKSIESTRRRPNCKSDFNIQKYDCKGRIKIWIYANHVRFFIRHRHHPPQWTAAADELVKRMNTSPEEPIFRRGTLELKDILSDN